MYLSPKNDFPLYKFVNADRRGMRIPFSTPKLFPFAGLNKKKRLNVMVGNVCEGLVQSCQVTTGQLLLPGHGGMLAS